MFQKLSVLVLVVLVALINATAAHADALFSASLPHYVGNVVMDDSSMRPDACHTYHLFAHEAEQVGEADAVECAKQAPVSVETHEREEDEAVVETVVAVEETPEPCETGCVQDDKDHSVPGGVRPESDKPLDVRVICTPEPGDVVK